MPHIHEKIDYTADVFVVYGDKVLLRKHEKYHLWLAVGGHIELDETPDVGALREVKEEVGLDVELIGDIVDTGEDSSGYQELLPPRYMNIHPISATHQHISLIYFARAKSDEVKPSGDDISNEWRWLTREELEKNELGVKPSIRFYALRALEAAAA